MGHDGNECAQLRNEAAEDEEDCAGGKGKAIDNLGHSHEAYVLAEGGVGQHAKECGKAGAQAVADNAASQLLIGSLALEAALHNAGNIAHGLHRGNDEHDAHGDNGTHIKNNIHGHEFGHGEPACVGHLIPVQHPGFGEGYALGGNAGGGQHQTHDEGRNIAGDDAEQNGAGAEEALGAMLEAQDDD